MSAAARRLIPLLAACSAIGSVGNFLFLPALPQIATHYEVTAGTSALTITTYLVAFACGVLLSGPLADRFGRRPILIGGVALCGLAALTCYFAPTMGWFVVARVVQGATGGVGITVSRASVGDLFEEHELARMYAVLTMALVLGTSLAPFMGGVITRHIGWQFIPAAGGRGGDHRGGVLRMAARTSRMPRTQLRVQARIAALLVRPLFMGVLQVALIYALFFVFASLAPYVMTTVPA
jgi:DHA1 family bicyclomycin/chloramphenicol resistance-like MFS transporter